MKKFFRKLLQIIQPAKMSIPPNLNNIPAHIAIIMDGNGRWAQQRGMPRIAGHREGVESLRECVRVAAEVKVKYLTVYAFSTENWQRPQSEVSFLMKLLAESIDRFATELNTNNVRLRFLGRIHELDPGLQEKIKWAHALTSANSGLNLQVLLNYGGRREIVDAAQKVLERIQGGEEIKLSEEEISKNTYFGEIPDPDLLIRTGGDMRISNFLLWEIAYAELYITPILWPSFKRQQFIEALVEFQRRNRRFGRV